MTESKTVTKMAMTEVTETIAGNPDARLDPSLIHGIKERLLGLVR